MNGTIKRLRELRALSQRDLAGKAGLSLATINRAEKGLHKPSPKTLRRLAKALHTTPEILLSHQLQLLEYGK